MNIKRNFILFSGIIAICGLMSCEKFLEKEPIGKVGKETLLNDVNGAKLALSGAYNTVLKYHINEFGAYADIASDNVNQRVGYSNPYMEAQFNFASTSDQETAAVGHIWLGIFEALNNTNNLLNAIPGLRDRFPGSVAALDSLKGQALVLRALCHFDLSNAYAHTYTYTPDASHPGVPVLTKTPSPGASVARSTAKDTYAQIITDIKAALPLLKKYPIRAAGTSDNNSALVTYQAAWALLSRIYLYMEEWDQAIVYADSVKSTSFGLAPAEEYKKMFSDYKSKGEVLFQLTGAGLSFATAGTTINLIFSDTSSCRYYASSKLTSIFDDADIRWKHRDTMFHPIRAKGDLSLGKPITAKYANGSAAGKAIPPFSYKVIRFAEVLLNQAEAYWHKERYAEAAENIRLVSQRAHPTLTVSVQHTDANELLRKIKEERQKELCFEGQRLFDLARWHEGIERGSETNSVIRTLQYPNNKFILPIPQRELDANKAMQPNPY